MKTEEEPPDISLKLQRCGCSPETPAVDSSVCTPEADRSILLRGGFRTSACPLVKEEEASRPSSHVTHWSVWEVFPPTLCSLMLLVFYRLLLFSFLRQIREEMRVYLLQVQGGSMGFLRTLFFYGFSCVSTGSSYSWTHSVNNVSLAVCTLKKFKDRVTRDFTSTFARTSFSSSRKRRRRRRRQFRKEHQEEDEEDKRNPGDLLSSSGGRGVGEDSLNGMRRTPTTREAEGEEEGPVSALTDRNGRGGISERAGSEAEEDEEGSLSEEDDGDDDDDDEGDDDGWSEEEEEEENVAEGERLDEGDDTKNRPSSKKDADQNNLMMFQYTLQVSLIHGLFRLPGPGLCSSISRCRCPYARLLRPVCLYTCRVAGPHLLVKHVQAQSLR